MKHISIRLEDSLKQLIEYEEELKHKSTVELVAELFSYLDYTEESDSGRVFHPITIGSCRVTLSPSLGLLLEILRKRVDGYE